MTSAFAQVKVDANNLSQECGKQGCEVGLVGIPRPFHLIDMDSPESPATGSRCDYLLIVSGYGRNGLYIAPLELKSSGFRVQAVSKQLAGGAKVAGKIVPSVQCRFVPIVAHNGAHRSEINKLARHPVRFRGKSYAIKIMKCGEYLAKHLKHSAQR